MNLYDILEVSPKASKEVIEKAYRVLCKKYHPDLQEANNRSKAEEMMKSLNNAYYTLNDDAKRAEYDKTLLNEQTNHTEYNQNQHNNREQETKHDSNFNTNVNHNINNNYNNQQGQQHYYANSNIDNWIYKNVINRDLIMMITEYAMQMYCDQHKVNLTVDEITYQRIIEASQNAILSLWHNDTTYIFVPNVYKNYDLETVLTREVFERLVEFYSRAAEENSKKLRKIQKIKDISKVIIFIIVLLLLIFNINKQLHNTRQIQLPNFKFFKLKL